MKTICFFIELIGKEIVVYPMQGSNHRTTVRNLNDAINKYLTQFLGNSGARYISAEIIDNFYQS